MGKSVIANALVLRPTSSTQPKTANSLSALCSTSFRIRPSGLPLKKMRLIAAPSQGSRLSSLLIIVRLLSSFSLTADTITAYTLLVPLSHCQHISRPPQSLPTHFSSHSVTANTLLVPLSHCQHISRPTQSLPTHFSSHCLPVHFHLRQLPFMNVNSIQHQGNLCRIFILKLVEN